MLIAHLTDLHVRPHGVPAYGVVDTNTLLERALRSVAGLKPAPDAVIMSGDLTDKGLDQFLKDYKKAFDPATAKA